MTPGTFSCKHLNLRFVKIREFSRSWFVFFISLPINIVLPLNLLTRSEKQKSNTPSHLLLLTLAVINCEPSNEIYTVNLEPKACNLRFPNNINYLGARKRFPATIFVLLFLKRGQGRAERPVRFINDGVASHIRKYYLFHRRDRRRFIFTASVLFTHTHVSVIFFNMPKIVLPDFIRWSAPPPASELDRWTWDHFRYW